MLIRGLIKSYEAIPLEAVWAAFGSEQVLMTAVKVFQNMFLSAFMMASPIVVALFLVDVSWGSSPNRCRSSIFSSSACRFQDARRLSAPDRGDARLFADLERLFENMFRALAQMMKMLGGAP